MLSKIYLNNLVVLVCVKLSKVEERLLLRRNEGLAGSSQPKVGCAVPPRVFFQLSLSGVSVSTDCYCFVSRKRGPKIGNSAVDCM